MTTKINLNDLKDTDYKALLENDKVTEKLIEFTSDFSSDVVNDWLELLDGVNDYSLGGSYDQYNYISVCNSYKFLDSVLVAQKDYVMLPDTLTEKIEKVLSDYEDSDLSSDFEDKLDMLSEQVANALVKYAESVFDYYLTESYLLETMEDNEVLLNIYGDDAYYNRDENKIYYICED